MISSGVSLGRAIGARAVCSAGGIGALTARRVSPRAQVPVGLPADSRSCRAAPVARPVLVGTCCGGRAGGGEGGGLAASMCVYVCVWVSVGVCMCAFRGDEGQWGDNPTPERGKN